MVHKDPYELMPVVSHPTFQKPAKSDVKIWRYMKFNRYKELLEKRSIWFARSDTFLDQLEGSTTAFSLAMRQQSLEENNDLGFSDFFSSRAKRQRQWTYISCWHMNDFESDAMWQLYASQEKAVAIQSTYFDLCTSLMNHVSNDNIYIGCVRYLDYDSIDSYINPFDLFAPYVHKRAAFNHEQELRAVIADLIGAESGIENKVKGKLVSVNVDSLINKVYVAPKSDEDFLKSVQKITEKYGVNAPIIHSSLSRQPLF